jgi:hypothetical protein
MKKQRRPNTSLIYSVCTVMDMRAVEKYILTKSAYGKHRFPFKDVLAPWYPGNLCEWEDWQNQTRNFSGVYKYPTRPLPHVCTYISRVCITDRISRNCRLHCVAAFYLFSYFSSSSLTVMSRPSVPLTIHSSLREKGKQIVRDPPYTAFVHSDHSLP